MRLVRPLAAFLLIGTAAAAQPAQYLDSPPPGQYAPPQGQYAPPPGQPGPQGQMPSGGAHNRGIQKFNDANITHDGRLTRDQAQNGKLRAIARNFDAIDRDHKGYVTIQDIRDWHRATKAASSSSPAHPPVTRRAEERSDIRLLVQKADVAPLFRPTKQIPTRRSRPA